MQLLVGGCGSCHQEKSGRIYHKEISPIVFYCLPDFSILFLFYGDFKKYFASNLRGPACCVNSIVEFVFSFYRSIGFVLLNDLVAHAD